MENPKVTIFMAVYNGEKYIKEAIDSALKQTFRNFELLIIDDGSTDRSLDIINTYKDSRIKVLRNDQNSGLFETRNRGIEEARGEYFATLDCDDIAFSRRLEVQLKYFENNPQSVICAGRIKYIDANSVCIGKVSALKGGLDYLRSLLMFTNFFFNSTTMIKMQVLREFQYREGYEPAEDFDLFERVSAFHPVGVIDDFLSYYRVHENNISTLKSQSRKRAEKEIIERQMQRYGFEYSETNLKLHLNFTTGEFDFDQYSMKDYALWLRTLKKQNGEKKVFDKMSFQLVITTQWLRLCKARAKKKFSLKDFFERGVLDLRSILKLISI